MNETIYSPRRTVLRRAVRFACLLDVEGVGLVEGVATDLSLHGLWIAVQEPLEVGVLVTARVVLPRTGHVIHIAGEIARVDATPFGFGMGVRFRHIPSSDMVALDAVLRGLPPRLPGDRRATLVERVVDVGDGDEDVVFG